MARRFLVQISVVLGPVVLATALFLALVLEHHPNFLTPTAAAVGLLSVIALTGWSRVHRSRIVLRGSVIVERPVEEVFPFFADPHNASLWDPSKRRFALASEGPVSAGTRFEFESRPPLSRAALVRCHVTEFEPDRVVATRLEGRTLTGREVSRFEPMGSSTRIETVNEVEVSSITAWFLKAQGSRALDSGLMRLKKEVEAGSPTAA
jgi:hypothetical protein